MKLESILVDRDPGDASVVFRAILKWVPSAEEAIRDQPQWASGYVMRGPDGLTLAWSILRGTGKRQRFFTNICDTAIDPRAQSRWPFMRLGPGVWDIPTSIFVDGQIHTFVTLIGVPEPAPWRKEVT